MPRERSLSLLVVDLPGRQLLVENPCAAEFEGEVASIDADIRFEMGFWLAPLYRTTGGLTGRGDVTVVDS